MINQTIEKLDIWLECPKGHIGQRINSETLKIGKYICPECSSEMEIYSVSKTVKKNLTTLPIPKDYPNAQAWYEEFYPKFHKLLEKI